MYTTFVGNSALSFTTSKLNYHTQRQAQTQTQTPTHTYTHTHTHTHTNKQENKTIRCTTTSESNNFRWLSTAKEAKILFFAPDINGKKFLPAHATRENFLSYLSPRLRGFPPFVVLSPAWSKLLFPLEHFRSFVVSPISFPTS